MHRRVPLPDEAVLIIAQNGAGGRSRTCDLLITNQLLYQLSYASELVKGGHSTLIPS